MRKLVTRPKLLTQVALALLLPAVVCPAYAAGLAATSDARVVSGPVFPITPPAAALQANDMPSDGAHGLGFVPNPAAPRPALYFRSATFRASLPATVDLSQYNPPVGNQSGVNSCVSWALGYYLRGWYAKRDGYYPIGGAGGAGSFAPMYLYSQVPKYDEHGNPIARDQNGGTRFADNLSILEQGIDTRADYSQGDYDYADSPTAGEAADASHYKLASYSEVGGPNLRNWIEATIAGGNPVAIGIPVYPEFDAARAANPLVGVPGSSEHSRGNHVVFASKYDANGLWIENQWGTSWGLNGWAELSWSFVNQYAFEAVGEAPLPPGGAVPIVIGELPSRAGATVRAAGFAVTFASAADRTCNNVGRVIGEYPRWASFGSTITLTIGARPRTPCP